MLKINQTIHSVVRAIDDHGSGVIFCGRDQVHVRQVLLGEEIEARVTKTIKGGYLGELVRIIKADPRRVKPLCPLTKRCGGCQMQHVAYPSQLEMKKQRIIDALKKTPLSLHVHDVQGMQDPYHYRNKMIIGFSRNNAGDIISGLYEESSHRIVSASTCLLHPKECDEVIATIVDLMKRLRIEPYDARRQRGFLRHAVIRYGVHTRQILVTLVTSEERFAARKAFVQQLTSRHPAVKSIVQNINRRDTSVVLGKQENILYGKGSIEDELLGKRFIISSSSFYQINHDQCERLYQKAYELLQLSGKERLLDAYCGIGTISLCVHEQAKEIIGVELNAKAVADARINARLNHVRNARFIQQDASAFMKQEAAHRQHYDAVIMDPPREGSTPLFLDACASLKPEKIVYISCDPFTQIRDLIYLKKKGYKAADMYLYDMFPMSDHVESVVLLRR